jgi:hypothetical protein
VGRDDDNDSRREIVAVPDFSALCQGVGRRAATRLVMSLEMLSREMLVTDVKLACDWCQCVGEQRVEQATARGVGVGQTSFEPVAQHHQFVNLGDDSKLFGARRESQWAASQLCRVYGRQVGRLADFISSNFEPRYNSKIEIAPLHIGDSKVRIRRGPGTS